MTEQEADALTARNLMKRKAGIQYTDAVTPEAAPALAITCASRAATPLEPRESELQRVCVAYLRARGIIVWELFKGSARGGSVFSTKGIPDLYIPSWGWIELKISSGVISIEQHHRHEELRKLGQRIAVITSLEALIEVIA